MGMSFSPYGFSSLSSLYFLVHEQTLSLCAEASDRFSAYKCYNMWNIASEIIICTSDPSVDSITHVVLLSKELGFLDLLENGTFRPILEWMNMCFGYLSRLTALDCIYF